MPSENPERRRPEELSARDRTAAETAEGNSATALTYAYLLEFYKALSEPARLQIAAVLSSDALTIAELASSTGRSVREVARDLSRLVSAGIVVETVRGSYAVDAERFRRQSRESLQSPRQARLAGATDDRSRTLATFMHDGRLTQWPTGDQRKLYLLEEIASRFEQKRLYTEREVNEQLKLVYEDYSTIRRALIDYHFMNRHKGVYWLGEGRLREPPAAELIPRVAAAIEHTTDADSLSWSADYEDA